MKIAIIGAGYVGLSNALLFAKNNKINIIDINQKRVNLLKNSISPIKDKLISKYLKQYRKNLEIFNQIDSSINECSYSIIATPTNFDSKKRSFDISSVLAVLNHLNKLKFKNDIIIRSTLPIGCTQKLANKFKHLSILYFPEFLREGNALYDSLYPSRIVAGGEKKKALKFICLLLKNAKKKNIPTLDTSYDEAEAIKLFSNTYLAMRIAFFNELDSFASIKGLNSEEIIRGLSMDNRIGNYYNNPSFGYGGYCLPKDSKQLDKDFGSISHKLIQSINQSNKKRKEFVSERILSSTVGIIGIYRLSMKKHSDNHRDSAIISIVKSLKKNNRKILIYEPTINSKTFLGIQIQNNFDLFIKGSDYIVANRLTDEIVESGKKVFSRDIFRKN